MATIVKNKAYKESIDLKTKIEFEEKAHVFQEAKTSAVMPREILDAQSKAQQILDDAKKQAQKIRQDAKEIFEQVQVEMENKRQEGFQKGHEEGLAQALEYLAQLHLLKDSMFSGIEPQVVKLSFNIAQKIIGDQLRENDQALIEVVRQAMQSNIGQKMTVKVSPDDFHKIKENESELLRRIDATKNIYFREDPAVKSGCVVESEVGVIDAQIETQLNAIKKALHLTDEPHEPSNKS